MGICDELRTEATALEAQMDQAEIAMNAAVVDYDAALVAFGLAFQDLSAKQQARTAAMATVNQLNQQITMNQMMQQMNNC